MKDDRFCVHENVDPKSLRLVGDHVLVRKIVKERAGYIILPKGERTECFFGEVIARGSGTYATATGEDFPCPFNVGEVLIVMQYAGQDADLGDGEEYKLIRDHMVWARHVTLDKESAVLELEPYADRILVKVRYDRKTTGGIFLLERENEHPNVLADVVKVGRGLRNVKTGVIVPNSVAPGDVAVMERYHGCDVKIKGVKHRVCQDKNLCATVEGLKE